MPEQSEGQTPGQGAEFSAKELMDQAAAETAHRLDATRAAEQARVDALPEPEINRVPTPAELAGEPPHTGEGAKTIDQMKEEAAATNGVADRAMPAPDLITGAPRPAGGNVTTIGPDGYGTNRGEYGNGGSSFASPEAKQTAEAAYRNNVGLPTPGKATTEAKTGIGSILRRLFRLR